MARTRRPYMAAKPPSDPASTPAKRRRGGPSKALAHKSPWKPTGRPSSFSPEIALEICTRLAAPESLRSICRDAHIPDRTTVWRWANTNPHFGAMLRQAQAVQAAAYMDEALELADNPAGDVIVKPDGSTITIWENVQRSKLRCDMRRIYAAKLSPEHFGEQQTTKLIGDASQPVFVDRMLTHSELHAQIEQLLAENEREIGLPTVPGLSHKERLRNITISGQPVTTELYDIMHPERGNGGK
jgi:hypothetical protein